MYIVVVIGWIRLQWLFRVDMTSMHRCEVLGNRFIVTYTGCPLDWAGVLVSYTLEAFEKITCKFSSPSCIVTSPFLGTYSEFLRTIYVPSDIIFRHSPLLLRKNLKVKHNFNHRPMLYPYPFKGRMISAILISLFGFKMFLQQSIQL